MMFGALRDQICSDFECFYKDRCIHYDSLCDFNQGCPSIYRKSICQCCILQKVCLLGKAGVVNGKHG